MAHIRRMLLQDTNAVYEISKACFSISWSLKSIEEEISRPLATYFVAEEAGEIIGYGGMWTILDEAEITNLAVKEKVRRKGIGQEILNQLLEEARVNQVRLISLEVRASNDRAISLYMKSGFVSVGTRKNYYNAPTEDAVIMQYTF